MSHDPLCHLLEHFCTVIVEQPDVYHYNYYRTRELHLHSHGQLCMHRISAYTQGLEMKGFVQLNKRKACANARKPVKYYYICRKNENYVTPEITVFNGFEDSPILMEMLGGIPFEEIAKKMTGPWFKRLTKEEKKSGNGRGNLRIDSGFSMTSRVDGLSVPGMNVPTRLRQCSMYDYIPPSGIEYDDENDGDNTFETTMTNVRQDVTAISDVISVLHGENYIHDNKERNKWWATKIAEESGASAKHVRSDNASVFLTGPMPDLSERQVTMHKDAQNDRRPGASDVIGISTVVPVTFELTGETVNIRSAMGLYNKQGCGDVAEKISLLKKPIDIVNDYMTANPTRSSKVQEGNVEEHVMRWRNNIDVVKMNMDEGWKAQWAHSDKSVYYSFYMHILLHKIIPAFGNVKAILYEAIYATALTTSQLGWKQGVIYAISNKNNGKNFIINWIDGLRDNHGHMGHGKFPRSMNSRGVRQYQVWKMYLSIYNLMRACEESDHLTPSQILKNMVKSPYTKRKVHEGLENVGMFQAQQLVRILTLMNLLTNKNVTNCIGVAVGTETYDRLMEMDPKMDKVVDCVLPVLSHALGISCLVVVENLFCEALRWYAGHCTTKFTKHDIILKRMKLYQIKDGNLYMGQGGKTMIRDNWMVYDTFDGKQYNPLIKWWTINPNLPERVLGEEDEMIVVSNIKN